jgi:hypothetical protein
MKEGNLKEGKEGKKRVPSPPLLGEGSYPPLQRNKSEGDSPRVPYLGYRLPRLEEEFAAAKTFLPSPLVFV